MAEHLYLPELKFDKKISPPSVNGFWKNDSRTIIRGISDAIEPGENAQGVSSIPDVWARPLMFQNFLMSVAKKLDPKIQESDRKVLNKLESKSFQEWKGILSILALSQTKLKYDKIELLPYQLPILVKGKKDPRFPNALRTLVPSSIRLERDKEYQWTDTIIIKYRDIPIGAFSPATLVFSAGDYNEEFKKQFEQKAGKSSDILDNEGYLCPPKNKIDLLAIGEWLEKVIATLCGSDKNDRRIEPLLNLRDEENETDKIIASTLKVLLDVWIKEIKKDLGKEDEEINSTRVKNSESILGFKENVIPSFLNYYSIYQALLKPLIPEAGTDDDKSDILLDYKRNKGRYQGRKVNYVIIISDQLYSEDHRLWNIQYSSLGNNINDIINKYFTDEKGVGQEIKGSAEATANFVKDGVIWVRPEKYFLADYLLTTKNDGYILNGPESKYNSNELKYILPFRKEILDFFTPEEIVELRPKYEIEGNKITFSFNLPVKNGDPINVKKSYRKKDPKLGEGSVIEFEVPVIEVFPDYLGENWKRYYLFQSDVDTFKVDPINVSSEFITKDRNYNIGSNKVRAMEISGNNPFPEGIQISDFKSNALGLVLLNKNLEQRIKEREKDTIKSMEIGIDFGTSNTNVYFLPENDEGKRWSYDFPKYIRQITFSNSEYRADILNNSLIPTREHLLPIPTALFNKNGNVEKPVLLLDYFIFFTKKENDYLIPQNVYTNLKWESYEGQENQGTRNNGINNTDLFIESLLFLIFLEISIRRCMDVTINCTFPKAFTQADMAQFSKYWEIALDKLLVSDERILDKHIENGNSEVNKNRPKVHGPYLMTEGIAAGYFFANPGKFTSTKRNKIEEAKLAAGAICLDVGGGTTDISIWYGDDRKALFDTSVLLAGKEISGFIRGNSELYNKLFSVSGADALKAKRDSETSFAAILNLILRAEEKDVYNSLAKNITSTSFQALRRIILIEFGAIAYYTGILCKSLFDKPEGKELLNTIQETGINLYWGGNGAKFISWLDYGQFDINSTCVKFLNTIFFYSLKTHGVNPHNKILQFSSTEPKSEACGGILVSEMGERKLSSGDGRRNLKSQGSSGNMAEIDLDELLDNLNLPSSLKQNKNEFITGEKIELIDGSFIESFRVIKVSELFDNNKTVVKNTTLNELELFVKILNQAALSIGLLKHGSEINLDDNKKADLKSHIINELKIMQNRTPDKQRVEPIFIQEVKKLMQLIS